MDALRQVTFTIPGRALSGNHTKGFSRDGVVFTRKKAREYQDRIRSLAFAAAREAKWIIPNYAILDMYLCNQKLDRDNAHKPIADALERILVDNDKTILDGRIVKIQDGKEPRIVIVVTETSGREYGYYH